MLAAKKYVCTIAIKHKLLYNFHIRETIYIGGAYSMDKNRITVYIAGQELRLAADDSEEYIRRIAGYVNDKVDEVQGQYPNLSTANCLILAALNLSDELHKLQEDYDALDSRISELRDMPRQSSPVKRPFETMTSATVK